MIESVLENFNIQYCAVETKMKKEEKKDLTTQQF
jgi:hypothetical protein